MRTAAIVCCFLAAVVLYAMGSAPGAGALFVLGVAFETLGWLKLFKRGKANSGR